MEKQKLPNEQAVMALGIFSFIGCCCTNGFLGIFLSALGIYLANKSVKIFNENPEKYFSLNNINTWKIVNWISMGLSLLSVMAYIYLKVTGKDVEIQERYIEFINEIQKK